MEEKPRRAEEEEVTHTLREVEEGGGETVGIRLSVFSPTTSGVV